jgi:hypothetical protein
MFQATTPARRPGRPAGYRPRAVRPAAMKPSRNSECSMPDDRPARAGADIGRRAGDGAGDAECRRTAPTADVGHALGHQLAVRPMARPVMPSATTADSSDSMAPSSAKGQRTRARHGQIFSGDMSGRAGIGGRFGRSAEAAADGLDRQASAKAPPRWLPRRSACPASAAAAFAGPGSRAMVKTASATAADRFTVPARFPERFEFGRESRPARRPGRVRPNRS